MSKTLDCSAIEPELTDYAFDQLEHKNVLDKDYQSQKLILNQSADPDEIRELVFRSCIEKSSDMIYEAKQGYDVGYELEELRSIHNTLQKSHITED